MGFVVSGLTTYVETAKDALIKRIVLGDTPNLTVDNLTKQTGIKTSKRLNYLTVAPVLQNGRGCGFTASGSTEFTDRLLDTAMYKINDQWCPDDLLNKFAENQVAIAAGKERLPFEEEITNEIVDKVNDAIEKLVWTGATSANSGTDLVDGFLTLALNQDSASTIDVAIESGSTVYAAIKAVYMALPEEILDKAVIFVSPALYRQYIQELVAANLYHYDPANGQPVEMFLPGTNAKVRNTKGLAGDKTHIYASCWENMVYGCDLSNDEESFKLWFSDDDDVFKLKIRWNFGVMTYYPDMVVLGTAAANLV